MPCASLSPRQQYVGPVIYQNALCLPCTSMSLGSRHIFHLVKHHTGKMKEQVAVPWSRSAQITAKPCAGCIRQASLHWDHRPASRLLPRPRWEQRGELLPSAMEGAPVQQSRCRARTLKGLQALGSAVLPR